MLRGTVGDRTDIQLFLSNPGFPVCAMGGVGAFSAPVDSGVLGANLVPDPRDRWVDKRWREKSLCQRILKLVQELGAASLGSSTGPNGGNDPDDQWGQFNARQPICCGGSPVP